MFNHATFDLKTKNDDFLLFMLQNESLFCSNPPRPEVPAYCRMRGGGASESTPASHEEGGTSRPKPSTPKRMGPFGESPPTSKSPTTQGTKSKNKPSLEVVSPFNYNDELLTVSSPKTAKASSPSYTTRAEAEVDEEQEERTLRQKSVMVYTVSTGEEDSSGKGSHALLWSNNVSPSPSLREPSYTNGQQPPLLTPYGAVPSGGDWRPNTTSYVPHSNASSLGVGGATSHPSLFSHNTPPLMSSTPIVPITNSTLDDVEIRKRIATDINHRLVLQPQQQAAEEEARQALEEAKMSRMSIKEVKRYKEEQKKKLKEKEKIEKEQAKKKMQEQAAIRQLPLPQQKENYIRVGVQRLINRVDELKLVLFRVKNDGNCQFRAISHQLFGTDVFHDLCRYHIVSYMKKRRHDKFDFYFESPAHADKYYQEMGQLGTWGDELTLRAASDSLCTNIHVISSAERNFYITYRPDSDAPPPPSFLIDVVQVKELRRRQKLEARRKEKKQSLPSYNDWMSYEDGSTATSLDERAHHQDPLHPPTASSTDEEDLIPVASEDSSSSFLQRRETNVSLQTTEGKDSEKVPITNPTEEEEVSEDDIDVLDLQNSLQEKLSTMRPQSAGNGSFFFPSASNAWSMPSNNSMVLDNNSIFIANDTTVTILHNNSLNNNNKGTENSSVKTFSKFTAAGAELQEAHFPGCDGSNNNNNSNNSEENGEIKSGLKRSGLSISATDTQFNVLRAEADLIRQMEEMNKTNNINGTPNNTTGRLLEPLQAAPPLAYETTGQQTPTSNSMTNNNNNSTEIPAYIFEKRKEPIDIFLSYIYPMHYNSIVVEHKK